jgi:hypothetical protein
MVGIKWDVGETESSRTIRGGGSVKVADWVMNFNTCIRNHRTGGIKDSAIYGCRVGLRGSVKTQCQTEKHHKGRMKRRLVRSQHEFLQKTLV